MVVNCCTKCWQFPSTWIIHLATVIESKMEIQCMQFVKKGSGFVKWYLVRRVEVQWLPIDWLKLLETQTQNLPNRENICSHLFYADHIGWGWTVYLGQDVCWHTMAYHAYKTRYPTPHTFVLHFYNYTVTVDW